jgi:hypothetical protein
MTATEKASLEATAANLRASIAARESLKVKDNPDFELVTAHEKARLAEVEAAISTKPKP